MAEKKIGGRTFRSSPMLATEALVLQARLLKTFGPAMARFGEVMQGFGADKTAAEKEKSNGAAVAALSDIFTKAEPLELANLIKDIVQVADIKRESGVYERCDLDGDFTAHKGDLIPVVVFVLREQFGDFFSGLPGIGSLGKMAAGLAKPE